MNINDWRVVLAIDWLCTPRAERQPLTQREFVAEIGISDEQFRQWRKDKDFLAAWEAKAVEIIGSPDRAQQIMDALFETATDRTDPRQVPAARAYLDAVEKIRPAKPAPKTVGNKKLRDMSDEELQAVAAAAVSEELGRREAGGD